MELLHKQLLCCMMWILHLLLVLNLYRSCSKGWSSWNVCYYEPFSYTPRFQSLRLIADWAHTIPQWWKSLPSCSSVIPDLFHLLAWTGGFVTVTWLQPNQLFLNVLKAPLCRLNSFRSLNHCIRKSAIMWIFHDVLLVLRGFRLGGFSASILQKLMIQSVWMIWKLSSL